MLIRLAWNFTKLFSMIDIHPTAVIFPGVVIEDGVHIGPYCIIGAKAKLGDSITYFGGRKLVEV